MCDKNSVWFNLKQKAMRVRRYLLAVSVAVMALTAWADDLSTGELAWMSDGSPAMMGQATHDHLFVRGTYQGETCDNIVAFDEGDTKVVWLWLDDDEFYQNDKVQALTPIPYNRAGDLYNEIAYNSFQCDLYLPQNVRLVSVEDEDGDEHYFAQGDRMPNTSYFYSQVNDSKMIDGKLYRVYRLLCTSSENYGCHFSAKNAARYQANGALKKDDAPLLGLYLRIDDPDVEGELSNMIIANQEFGFREAFTNDPVWEPNDYRFVYGTGGNNQTQRFQYYHRVRLFGAEPRPITETPVITTRTTASTVVITATGLGEVVLKVDGEQVENPFTIARGAEDVTVVATATAQEEGKNISDVATMSVVIPARVMPTGDNGLVVPASVLAEVGYPFDLHVEMENTAEISALQCDVTLPEGIALAENGVTLVEERAAPSHSVSVRSLGNGVHRLLIASPVAEVFNGYEGDLFVLHFNVDPEMAEGAYTVTLSDIVLADAQAVTYTAPDVDATVIVKSYGKGDANGDGAINVGDYVTVANYIMELDPDPFVFSAADVDDSETINVGDLVGIVNLVLGDGAENTSGPRLVDDVLMKGCACITIDGTQCYVSIDLYNRMDLTAWQMDMDVPKGLTLQEVILSQRTARHNLVYGPLADGRTRFLISSPVNDDLVGNDGELLTIVFDKNSDFDSQNKVLFDNILLAEHDMTTHAVSGFAALYPGTISVEELRNDVRIYARGNDIVVETPVETTVEIIMTNGMSRTVTAKAGTNIYPVGKGIHIVRANGQVTKLKI